MSAGQDHHDDDILSDWRRLNVAVTRAKAKLWVIGNAKALKTYAPFGKMLDYSITFNLQFWSCFTSQYKVV